ncbi:hypothetical protein GTA08_BOTSDO04692 [Botryosphaeria dothidea]|uniref:Uncharacterized protein n=1 Tax=Botryosphaeria dothidea TaxID=55169 RepID=A0A8H4J0W2_9PEZI|nr:hypothetical protein GTA08_BOTSDO04692 [Botryosphaeria dothidea]
MPPSAAYQQQPITDDDALRATLFPPRLADPAHPDEEAAFRRGRARLQDGRPGPVRTAGPGVLTGRCWRGR